MVQISLQNLNWQSTDTCVLIFRVCKIIEGCYKIVD